jgi:hypothetical protein
VTESEYPIDPIGFSTPGDADKVVAIESWNEGGVEMVTVEFTDGEIQSLPMSKAEARAKADRCFGPDKITETAKNGLSYRWTRMP